MVNKFCKGTFIEKGILKISFQWILIFLALNLYSILYIWFIACKKIMVFLYIYSLNNDLHSIHIHVKSFTLLIFIICTYRFFMRIVYRMFYVATYYIFAKESTESRIFIDSHERQSFLCESEKKRINICVFPQWN